MDHLCQSPVVGKCIVSPSKWLLTILMNEHLPLCDWVVLKYLPHVDVVHFRKVFAHANVASLSSWAHMAECAFRIATEGISAG